MASSSGRQPNFAALNKGRHLYSAGRPSGWALAHILVRYIFKKRWKMAYTYYQTTNENKLLFFCCAALNSVQFATMRFAIWL